MAYSISCDCGYVSRGETEDELVDEANQHIDEVHPDMAARCLGTTCSRWPKRSDQSSKLTPILHQPDGKAPGP